MPVRLSFLPVGKHGKGVLWVPRPSHGGFGGVLHSCLASQLSIEMAGGSFECVELGTHHEAMYSAEFLQSATDASRHAVAPPPSWLRINRVWHVSLTSDMIDEFITSPGRQVRLIDRGFFSRFWTTGGGTRPAKSNGCNLKMSPSSPFPARHSSSQQPGIEPGEVSATLKIGRNKGANRDLEGRGRGKCNRPTLGSLAVIPVIPGASAALIGHRKMWGRKEHREPRWQGLFLDRTFRELEGWKGGQQASCEAPHFLRLHLFGLLDRTDGSQSLSPLYAV